jgi:hypothetical protein
MVTLATNLSNLTGTALPDLLREFGRHLFKRFLISFPAFFEGITSSWEFLPKVQSYVHMEVLKLHPDAELPVFTCTIADPETLVMTYQSRRNLPDPAEGLILACVEYFDEPLTATREAGSGEPPETRFILTPQRKPAHG